MKTRLILSLGLFLIWGWLSFFFNAGATLATAEIAGKQFDNSDAAYILSQSGMHFFSWASGLRTLVLLVLIAAIWWAPLRRWLAGTAVALAVLFVSAPAYAYYDKNDYTENFFILPNESAFFIPDVGANASTQTKFGSREYFEANKIAAKRFSIPHVILTNSGLFSNYYVPAGRLIVVDRTPYNREWTASNNRGTSAADQSFVCQSKEGLNLTIGISIGTSVLEENASTFLYRFGVNAPQGNRFDPVVTFTSVYFGKSLEQVMEGPVHSKVQSLVCDEISARTFDDANAQAPAILTDVTTKVTAYLLSVGITLDFIGWADSFGFDPLVQKAVNDAYIAKTIAPVLATLQAQADIKVKEGLGEGLQAHGLPANLVTLPTNLLDGFTSMLGGKK